MSDTNFKKDVFFSSAYSVSIEGIKKILFQLDNCICQISLKNGRKGTGFFCTIIFQNKLLPVLITNNHILGEKYKK